MKRSGFWIGSSDAPVLMGVGYRGRTPADLFDVKMGHEQPEDLKDDRFVQRGIALEPFAAAAYATETERELQELNGKPLYHSEHDWILARPDRLILGEDPTPPLELKCPWSYIFRGYQREGMGDYAIVQLLHQCMVLGSDWGSIGAFSGDTWELLTADVEVDPDLMEQLQAREWEFYHKNLLADIRPDAKPAEPVDLPEIVPGELVKIDGAGWLQAVTDYFEARAIRADAEEHLESCKGEITTFLDAHETDVAEGAGARFYNREQQGRARRDWKALKAARPLDGAKVQQALSDGGLLTRELLKALKEGCGLDLDRFETRGKPFKSMRGYDLEGRYS